MVKGVIITLVIALACMLRLYVHQMNVSNSFCYADIAGDVCVSLTDERGGAGRRRWSQGIATSYRVVI